MQKIVGDSIRAPEQRDPHGVGEARALLDTAYAWLDDVLADREWAAATPSAWPTAPPRRRLFYADWAHPIDASRANVIALPPPPAGAPVVRPRRRRGAARFARSSRSAPPTATATTDHTDPCGRDRPMLSERRTGRVRRTGVSASTRLHRRRGGGDAGAPSGTRYAGRMRSSAPTRRRGASSIRQDSTTSPRRRRFLADRRRRHPRRDRRLSRRRRVGRAAALGRLHRVTFPVPGREWTVPPLLWHADFPFDLPPTPLPGVKVFVFVSDVPPRGGGTLVVTARIAWRDGWRRKRRRRSEATPAACACGCSTAIRGCCALTSSAERGDRVRRFDGRGGGHRRRPRARSSS